MDPNATRAAVISDRLRTLMSREGIHTFAQLAERVGMDQGDMSRKVNGIRRWYLDELDALADALGSSIGAIIGDLPIDPADLLGERSITELARRLAYLADHLEVEVPEDLLKATGTVRLDRWRDRLSFVADRAGVDRDYLLDLDPVRSVELLEAQIQFAGALRKRGVVSISTRSLGSSSPEEIRALARAILGGNS